MAPRSTNLHAAWSRADEFAKARALVEGEVSKRFWCMASSMAQDNVKWR